MSEAIQKPMVLAVDDEEHITELIVMGLGINGFEVERAASGRGALAAVEHRRPDLIVLDVMLPDLDGFEVARRLRLAEGAGARVPIIFLTARDATQDKIEGLRLGSDDYVTKPFSIEELVERVKAVLRRSMGTGPGEHRLSYADLELDDDTREVWRAGRLIELTATEYKLLLILAERRGRVQDRANLLESVWDAAPDIQTRTVDMHVQRLRTKLGAAGDWIETVRAVGYRFREPVVPPKRPTPAARRRRT